MKKQMSCVVLALLLAAILGGAGPVAAAYDIAFGGDLAPRSTYAGYGLSYDITITTEVPAGGVPSPLPHILSFEAVAPSSWDVSLSESSVIMGEGTSRDIRLLISVPSSAAPGTYAVTVNVNADIGKRSTELAVEVLAPFDVVMSSFSSSPAVVRVGEQITVSAQVRMNGPASLDGKVVALYIDGVSRSKVSYTMVDLTPDSVKTVTLSWTATQSGTFTSRMYINPTLFETSTANNQVAGTITILPPEDPCNLAHQVYAEALVLYEADCASATSALTAAQSLYEQCGDAEGVQNCTRLLERCVAYAQASDLVDMGNAFEAGGSCMNAVIKWQEAICIYRAYDDDAMVGMLTAKIEQCMVEDVIEEESPIYIQYWWAIALAALCVILLALLLLRSKRGDEGDEGGEGGYYPPSEGPVLEEELPPEPEPLDFEHALLAEMEGAGAARPRPSGGAPPSAEVKKFIEGLDDALTKLDEETIKEHLTESVNVYGKAIDKRNALMPEMDEAVLAAVDGRLRELEERIYQTL
ncbi:MAG: hypothetical protein KO463_08025 [Candidatus Methanofastidiosa archaeon]|nr:hypothetical protein [Candidatus Methanofastidiosa archaeon]